MAVLDLDHYDTTIRACRQYLTCHVVIMEALKPLVLDSGSCRQEVPLCSKANPGPRINSLGEVSPITGYDSGESACVYRHYE
jgi:hypothetical protein